jgi:predicted kinase
MSYYIIIRGPLGSGKSSVAAELSRMLKAELISIDAVLEANGLEDDIEEGYISQRSFIRANELMAQGAEALMDSGTPVIFDGNFYWRSQLEDLIRRLRHEGYVFTLKAGLDVCISRDWERKSPHGAVATKAVYSKSTSFEYGVGIDANGELAEVVASILTFIHGRNQKP